ncbi:MAG: hypothetical protein Q8L64_01295 [bacterium]|nr:hypothetical protein [bacterium]
MNAKLLALATLLVGSGLAWGQDIVLKAEFTSQGNVGQVFQQIVPIDVDEDGVPEIPYWHCGYYNSVTSQRYKPGMNAEENYYFAYDEISRHATVSQMRSSGLGEWILRRHDPDFLVIEDIASGDVILQLGYLEYQGDLMVYDYDLDGLDDLLIFNGYQVRVYGIPTGNPPISPPQELDIQTLGNDYLISWTPVANATAYRIEWSSAIDGLRFTRIGYATGTTFTHRNQVGQERGFYRVLSEDNGTGLVRMVGLGR